MVISGAADHTYTYLSNGDDGFALVYGSNPGSPVDPVTGGYVIVDFIGDWNGDPGSGWSVAGVTDATKDHTLLRKCDVTQGNSDWIASAGTDAVNSEWIVMPIDDWTDIGVYNPCSSINYGCTDTSADNYDATATIDDGSCIYPIFGCTDSTAVNYDALATVDDGSCVYSTVLGCTDPTADNYDATATVDDGSCIYTILGCTDSTATNYDATATVDDGSCTYPAAMANLYFSEFAEGSSNNKYFEVYNPTSDTVYLSDYAYPSVSNAPSTVGVYEYWNDFDAGAFIAPGDVYVVAHPSADPIILAEADETHPYLSNGDDGYGLVYGSNPGSPVDPVTGGYVVLDFIGDWNGDPGSGWTVAGVANATKDHTLVRKCDVVQGNIDWMLSAGTTSSDSEWEVYPQNDWTYLGYHTSPCPQVSGCTDPLAQNYDATATVDDGSCTYTDCAGIVNGTAIVDSCGICNQAYIYNFITHAVIYVDNANILIAGVDYNPAQEIVVIPGDVGDPYWNASCSGCTDPTADNYDATSTIDDGSCTYTILGCTDPAAVNYDATATVDDGSCSYVVSGCTDSTATNYDATATVDDGSCTYPAAMANLYFSEFAEGSSNNKYFEVYNPTSDTVYLSDYAYPSVSNAPSTVGVYEYWNDFDAGAFIAPGDVYVVAHPSADPIILAEADETHPYLSNGDDGYGLVYGSNPGSPVDPVTGGYVVLDFIGDWNGDPGSGWTVAGVANATKDHTLVRKCDVVQGNIDWMLSAGTTSSDSEWEVYPQNDWTYLGYHTSPCPQVSGCTDPLAQNYDATATVDDGSCTYISDCAGIVNGTAIVDSCGICNQAYIYNFITHAVIL